MNDFIETAMEVFNGSDTLSKSSRHCNCNQLHRTQLGFEIALSFMCILLLTNLVTIAYIVRRPAMQFFKRLREVFSRDDANERLFTDSSD